MSQHNIESVKKREQFLRYYYKPGLKFWELGKERYLKNEKAIKLLIELQNRYPSEKETVIKIELTRKDITGNDVYALD